MYSTFPFYGKGIAIAAPFFVEMQNLAPLRVVYIKNVFLLLQKKTIMNTELIETIREYFKTQPVLKAWIFGSYARGEETPLSDVDLLVQYDEGGLVC